MQMYETTQDKDLLQEKVYPYLRGVVDFYVNPDSGRSYLATGKDGKLHVPYSCGDEICSDEAGGGGHAGGKAGGGQGVDPMEDMVVFSPLFLRFSIGKCRNCPFFRAFY